MLALLGAVGPPALPEPPGRVPPSAAESASAAVNLDWQAPPPCPAGQDVRGGIAALLDDQTPAEAAADVVAEARVAEAAAGGFRLELRIETPSGQSTRTLSATDCRTLAETTSLIIAIAIDPSAVFDRTDVAAAGARVDVAPGDGGETEVETTQDAAREEESEPSREPEPEDGPAEDGPAKDGPAKDGPAKDENTRSRQPADERTRPSRTPRASPLIRFAMRAAAGIDFATLPGVAADLRFFGAVFGPRWRVEVGADYLVPRTGFATDDAGGRISLWAIGARGCWVPVVRRLEIPVCGGAEAGLARGEPVGSRVGNPQTVREPWFAGVGSVGFAWAPRPYLALVGRPELVVPFARPGFEVGDITAHRIPPASGRVFLGIEGRFP